MLKEVDCIIMIDMGVNNIVSSTGSPDITSCRDSPAVVAGLEQSLLGRFAGPGPLPVQLQPPARRQSPAPQLPPQGGLRPEELFALINACRPTAGFRPMQRRRLGIRSSACCGQNSAAGSQPCCRTQSSSQYECVLM